MPAYLSPSRTRRVPAKTPSRPMQQNGVEPDRGPIERVAGIEHGVVGDDQEICGRGKQEHCSAVEDFWSARPCFLRVRTVAAARKAIAGRRSAAIAASHGAVCGRYRAKVSGAPISERPAAMKRSPA